MVKEKFNCKKCCKEIGGIMSIAMMVCVMITFSKHIFQKRIINSILRDNIITLHIKNYFLTNSTLLISSNSLSPVRKIKSFFKA